MNLSNYQLQINELRLHLTVHHQHDNFSFYFIFILFQRLTKV